MIDSTTNESESTPEEQTASLNQNRRVMRAAVIITAANVVQRILGMAREVVKANLFGASGFLSAFTVASLVPMTLYNLIVGGEMVTSSLVPVFSDYASLEGGDESIQIRRQDLWHVLSTFLSLTAVLLFIIVLIVEIFTPQVAWLVGARDFDDPQLFALTVQLMRLTTPAVLFLSLSSIITAALYALQRFTLPAFTIATLNATMIIAALLRPDQISSLGWGLLIGAILQVVLQLPALRDARLRLSFDWRHPALRRVVKLYIPIVGGLVINQAVIWISYNLAIETGDASVTYMTYATTLYQLPLGLVVMGLSTATLPMLAQQANGRIPEFKQTLAQGIRLVITLVLPAAVGMFVLAQPVVRLLFEHGQFLAQDTEITSRVLQVYVFGMPFAAVDQMLVYASYARKDTLSPALVGVFSVIIYLIVALALKGSIGLYSLMAADAIKHMVHTALMFWLLHRHLGGLRGHQVLKLSLKALLGAALTGITAYGVVYGLSPLLTADSFFNQLLWVAVPAVAGLVVYVLAAVVLDIRELKALRTIVRRR
ncbi:MAG: murein biosynthesis integral membrane protein MurJ [Anaerolineales bacterium]|nr:murein biosynthesis integral membrane protein MurJ [Anaerolineales bacterium]